LGERICGFKDLWIRGSVNEILVKYKESVKKDLVLCGERICKFTVKDKIIQI